MQEPPPLPTVNPYAAPAARVFDQLQTGERELAERGTRLLAVVVDGMIYGLVAMTLAVILPMFARNDARVLAPMLMVAFGAAMLALIAVNCVLLHRYGQTIAKRMFKIKIVRTDGSRCSLPHVIFVRALPIFMLGLVPLVGPMISLCDPLLIFRDDQRCLHDHIADTIVVKS
jgi:uncharacterized RDD family membrane protein YckC